MPKDPPGYGIYSWWEEQDYIERPRMRRESDTDYAMRRSVASLSWAIITSLQSSVHRYEY